MTAWEFVVGIAVVTGLVVLISGAAWWGFLTRAAVVSWLIVCILGAAALLVSWWEWENW